MLLLKMSRTICSMSNWSHCFCMWKDVLVVHNERMLWHQSISSILEWFPSQRASNAAPLSKDKNSPSLLCCRGLAEEGFFHLLSYALQHKSRFIWTLQLSYTFFLNVHTLWKFCCLGDFALHKLSSVTLAF